MDMIPSNYKDQIKQALVPKTINASDLFIDEGDLNVPLLDSASGDNKYGALR